MYVLCIQSIVYINHTLYCISYKTHSISNIVGDFVPFRFSVPFGGIQTTQVNVVETMIKPLICATTDIGMPKF